MCSTMCSPLHCIQCMSVSIRFDVGVRCRPVVSLAVTCACGAGRSDRVPGEGGLVSGG